MLAASIRQKSRRSNEMAVFVGVGAEAAGLTAEEFAPLISLLVKDAAGRKAPRAAELLAIRWAELDPAAALAFALDLPEFKGNWSVISCIVEELAKTDLPAAKAAVRALDEELRWEGGRAVARIIQEKDTKAALAYTRELGDEGAEAEVLKLMAEHDPMAAAAELTPGKDWQKPTVELIASLLLKGDRAAFEAWAGSLVDPGQRAVARSQALMMDNESDPKEAAKRAAAWLAEEPESASLDERVPEQIVQRWIEGEASLSEVAAWAASLPAGQFRDRVVLQIGAQWPSLDMVAASAWVASLPESESKDIAIARLVDKLSGESPADAFEWARTVGNPSRRYETLMNTLRVWAQKDFVAAQSAVETLLAGDQSYMREFLKEQERDQE